MFATKVLSIYIIFKYISHLSKSDINEYTINWSSEANSGFRRVDRRHFPHWRVDAPNVDGAERWLRPPKIPERILQTLLYQIVVTSIFGFFRPVTSSPQLGLRGRGGDLKLPINDWGVNDSNPVNALTVCRRWVSGYGPRFNVWITLEECELHRLKCRIRKLSRDFFTPLCPTTAYPKLIFALKVCVGKVWLMMALFISRETF